MNSLTLVFVVILVILIICAGLVIMFYNRLISLKNETDESWSGVDVQLKRRYDLIPNIVEAVKGYSQHESSTFQKIVTARNQAMSIGNQDLKAKAKVEGELAGMLRQLFALSESYPDLKASQNFIQLQQTLSEIENDLQNSRRYYNAVVRDYNIACQTFPSLIIASFFNFKGRAFFEIEEQAKKNVEVKF